MPLIVLLLVAVGIVLYFRSGASAGRNQSFEFGPAHQRILEEKVAFYRALDTNEKRRFEEEVTLFLRRTRVTGIGTAIDDTDKLLVAASAVIPVFAFKGWRYHSITEVLVYPNSFNADFETAGNEKGRERLITGMVGTGAMNGTMILSRQALHHGFQNNTDKQNTAVHEFAHLVDKADGAIDGIPENLLDKQYTLPWIKLMAEEIKKIEAGKSDINPYGATNQAEFFAVASEYFFERPQLLQQKHPELYTLLESVYDQNMNDKTLADDRRKPGRNEPCTCNSGNKFKNCCGAVRYVS